MSEPCDSDSDERFDELLGDQRVLYARYYELFELFDADDNTSILLLRRALEQIKAKDLEIRKLFTCYKESDEQR